MPASDDRAGIPDEAPTGATGWSRGHWALLTLLVLGGAVLRVAAANNDLWLDEIWTIVQVNEQMESLFDVFTRIRRENHALYTMWVFLVGTDAADFVFRLPAVVAGIAVIPLAAWIAHLQWRSPAAGLFAAALVAASYLQLHYGTEARGYAPAVALALLAWILLLRGRDGSVWWRVAYGLVLCVGFVAQPLVLNFLIAAGLYTLIREWRSGSIAKALVESIAWHGVPAMFFVFYYLAYLRHLVTGGGPEYALSQVVNDTVAYTFGLPVSQTMPWLALCVGVAVLVGGVVLLLRARDDSWSFYIVGVAVAPIALIVVRGSPFVYERYFVLNTALLLLLTSGIAAWCWSRSTAARIVATGLLLAMIVGSAHQATGLLRLGRGDYRGIARLIAEQSVDPTVTFAGDHVFRIAMVMDYHFPRAVPGRPYRQVKKEDGPPWLLLHEQTLPAPPTPPFLDLLEGRYEHVRTFRYARLSGWHTAVYRRVR